MRSVFDIYMYVHIFIKVPFDKSEYICINKFRLCLSTIRLFPLAATDVATLVSLKLPDVSWRHAIAKQGFGFK